MSKEEKKKHLNITTAATAAATAAVLATNIEFMKKEITEIKTNYVIRFDSLDKKLDDRFDSLDKKFAYKWVEKVLWSGGAIIGATVLYALLNTIINKLPTPK